MPKSSIRFESYSYAYETVYVVAFLMVSDRIESNVNSLQCIKVLENVAFGSEGRIQTVRKGICAR